MLGKGLIKDRQHNHEIELFNSINQNHESLIIVRFLAEIVSS